VLAAVDAGERERLAAILGVGGEKVLQLQVFERGCVVVAATMQHQDDGEVFGRSVGRERERPANRGLSRGRREAARFDRRAARRGSGVDVALAGELGEPDPAGEDTFFDTRVAADDGEGRGAERAKYDGAPGRHRAPPLGDLLS